MSEQSFEADEARGGARWDAVEGRLVVDLDGYEGPLDVLLSLAREQKVDLARISILDLADQYISFIERAHELRLEIAADYLVMAAWLAYLKSRLLLPEPGAEDEPTAEEMASALAFQLRRLEAMREAGARLMARPLLGRDVFARGAPEGVPVIEHKVFDLGYYDLLKAYADHRQRTSVENLRLDPVRLHTMDQAMHRLEHMLGGMKEWTTLMSFLPPGLADSLICRSAAAATFAACLELTRQGRIELRQSGAFSPVYLRASGGKR
ncbi:MAG: segregation and condensation protein A [Alphaproteobacteria bacterium]